MNCPGSQSGGGIAVTRKSDVGSKGFVPARYSIQFAKPSLSESASAPVSFTGRLYWASHHSGTPLVTRIAVKFAVITRGPVIEITMTLEVLDPSPDQFTKR